MKNREFYRDRLVTSMSKARDDCLHFVPNMVQEIRILIINWINEWRR